MTRTTKRAARRSTALLGVAATAALLAGCADELPQPVADEPFTGPVLTLDQETAVVDDVAATLDEASEEQDPDLLKDRVTGPALDARKSEMRAAEAMDDDPSVTEIPTGLQATIIPTTDTWPRVSYTITEGTEDLGVPRMLAYQQDSARDNYNLWSWVQLIPGTTMPNFADSAAIGSEAVPVDDESLQVSPLEALTQYADLTSKGVDDSEYAEAFELPAESQDLVKRIAADTRNAASSDDWDDAGGKYNVKFVQRDDQINAVRTSDGGAVVMGALDGNARIKLEDGGTIPPFGDVQEALLDEDPTNELYVEYIDQVALYVPPAGSDEPMRPLGYAHVISDVTNEIPEASDRNTDRDSSDDE